MLALPARTPHTAARTRNAACAHAATPCPVRPPRPNFHNFTATVQLLKDWGADLSSTKVSAKHIDCPLMRRIQAAQD